MTRSFQVASMVAVVSLALCSSSRAQMGPHPQTPSNPQQPSSPSAEQHRADMLISHMTLQQKVEQISNDTRPAENPANRPPGCEFTPVGRHIQGIPQLGIPTIRMINGPTGVRGGDCKNEPTSTALPSSPALAATFNPGLVN